MGKGEFLMREYGKVSGKFWVGKSGKALRGKPEAQIVALYLMTCPTSEMSGVFHCPVLYIAHETGLGMEGATKGLQSLIESDYCSYDDESEYVFVHEMARYQIGEELKVNDNQVKSIKKAYLAMSDVFKPVFFERYKDAFHLIDKRPLQAPPKPRAGTSTGTEAGAGSVPIGTGGEPPAGQGEDPKTPDQMTKDELWSAGKSLLAQQGMPVAQCGSFVGKLVKDYSAEIVVEAVRSAVVERPADAVSFLKAACMARKGEGGKTLIPWHATDAGVLAKGVELSLAPNPGESMLQFKARLIAAIDNGGKPPEQRPGPVVVVRTEVPRALKPEGIVPLKSLVKLREQA
jgi:hypothetical protein